MLDINQLKKFYPLEISNGQGKVKHILKEYVELISLKFLSGTEYMNKLAFIGGTNLRLLKKIDRFSEDLDFDCKNLSKEDFIKMTDSLVSFLKSQGFNVETKDKESENLKAFRRSIIFPGLLYDLNLTGHKEERFLLKIEAQDQGIAYQKEIKQINLNGFNINIPVPPDDILCSMKLSALLGRSKGRDFYDSMFLLQQTAPNFDFLKKKQNIGTAKELKDAVEELVKKIDLNLKEKDFDQLLFDSRNSSAIHGIVNLMKSLVTQHSNGLSKETEKQAKDFSKVKDVTEETLNKIKENEKLLQKVFQNNEHDRLDLLCSEKNKSSNIIIPATFSKEAIDVIKEYTTLLGGKFLDAKIKDEKGRMTSAIISFDETAKLPAEICKKIIMGETTDKILNSIKKTLEESKKQMQSEVKNKKKRGLGI